MAIEPARLADPMPRFERRVLVGGLLIGLPAWVIAAPVLNRIERLLRHRRRGFVERREERLSPRGRIEWGEWARRSCPRARWTRFPCTFSEPMDDPVLLARVRWTLRRLEDELVDAMASAPARLLRARADDLLAEIGPGPMKRTAGEGGGG